MVRVEEGLKSGWCRDMDIDVELSKWVSKWVEKWVRSELRSKWEVRERENEK